MDNYNQPVYQNIFEVWYVSNEPTIGGRPPGKTTPSSTSQALFSKLNTNLQQILYAQVHADCMLIYAHLDWSTGNRETGGVPESLF